MGVLKICPVGNISVVQEEQELIGPLPPTPVWDFGAGITSL